MDTSCEMKRYAGNNHYPESNGDFFITYDGFYRCMEIVYYA